MSDYVMVPKLPTPDMRSAGLREVRENILHTPGGIYRAMLAAAPPALSAAPAQAPGREVRKVACDHCQRMTVVPDPRS